MSYQSVLRNSSNVLLANTAVGIRISVLQGSATGSAVYVETQTATTNGNGLVSIQIGTGAATTGTFAGIDWAAGPYFIKTETDPAGGSNYSITGTQEILSVPYAMYAAKSGDATIMGVVGGSSSANGGTITAGVLSLTPADATNGGIVTTGTQTFAGNKLLTGTLGVGTTTPSASAKVEIASTTQGFLPPRMTFAQRNSITSPATGLVIFCTDCGQTSVGGEVQVYSGGMWRNMMGSAAGTDITIGSSYGGGKIAYILQPGDPGYDANTQHGLIAATSDQSTGIRWYNGSYIVTGATGTAIGTGLSNTNIIIASQGATATSYAAGLARAYTGGGYTDWYLPSQDELNKLYLNKAAIGGFASAYYWSSTENNNLIAWEQGFDNGFQASNGKNLTVRGRAVRAF
ncbi:Legionella vir region protein [Flavobacteria bacterium BAL38]|nr:Legionella vir region protein [Flavobacteria bacterium BAL38]